MTRSFSRVAVTGFVVQLALASATAEAAKGIKKSNQGHHTISGVVTNVVPDKTGYGIFHLRTSSNHKKAIAANGAAAGANANQQNLQNQSMKQFNVTTNTRFEHHVGTSANVVNAAALHKGQRVRVTYSGQHAEQVHIYTSQRMGGNFTRHRPPSYHPHIHYRRR